MRKPELAAAIAEKADLTKEKAAEVLNAVTDQIAKALGEGDSVTLIGFGTFEVRNRAERQGKNPQTGAPITIAAAKVPAFKPGKGLKEIVQ
ncbi:MAG: HU family DNA-binding protein [Thalassolituus sp.]|jgi:DNA-binding protein HU-alpha|uniref:HupA gene product n=2 Tax=root TaxID=1 RepID=M5DNC1_9GAMM|nr:HU family DNA-binding protein [Thalassolituus oleivorans]PCI50271.1 MAG: HU family DNA-binding protein [Oceanospirillales bacterium]AHK14703.1 transcriptional regulator [Thalassolituus oleivorans R6-15]APR65695.1 DNA-binding protein HU [Thalassolituus oleivorans]MBQ0726095.1 HU family DNA-binding protein [Thalassolituus oleivorans]MBQ0779710.1 HU family DNA-binding protein [Thalassolituus oleivorans]|tara:strand:- start:43 stop:315 length:273 start_codon:yes stop_codon:yes gene_type:complete